MTHLLLFFTLFLQLPSVQCTVTTLGQQTVFAGQSITVPCHYSREYIPNVKYWCKGYIKDFCSTLARTDQAGAAQNARISIADDPTQNMFTVTMHDLKENDSGWYWCGVEIGGVWSKDSTATLYINVIQGISVAINNISAEEGGSVTVKCLYSEKHRENEKKWCRSGQVSSCKITSNGTYSTKSLLISDDRKDTVTVTMMQLQVGDAGWYWCGAGEHQEPVFVEVIPRSTTSAEHLSEVKDQSSTMYTVHPYLMCLICGVLLLLLTVFFVAWSRFKKRPCFRKHDETETELAVCPRVLSKEKRKLQNSSVVFLNTLAHQVHMM